MLYLTLKYAHVVGAIVLLGTGGGIAFFMLIARRTGDARHVALTARLCLLAGNGVSTFYLAGAATLTPAMWLEPLGALVKTFPAIVLMGVCLATLDDR